MVGKRFIIRRRQLRQAGIALGVASCALGARGRSAEPAPPAKVRLDGEVVGKVGTPEKKPVRDVAVFWIERTAEGGVQRRFVAHTDAQGGFRFAEAPPKPEDARSVMLLAQTPDWGLSFRNLHRNQGENDPLTLTLQPATALRVAFVDQAGK